MIVLRVVALSNYNAWVMRGDVAIIKETDYYRLVSEDCSLNIKVVNQHVDRLIYDLSYSGACRPSNDYHACLVFDEMKRKGLIHISPLNTLSPLETLQWTWNESFAPNQSLSSKLKASKVLIVGCGGTGSIIAQSLAGSGVGHFTLIDFDVVSVGNLNRQFVFGIDDVNNYKAQVLAKKIMESQKVLSVNVHLAEIKSTEQLDKMSKSVDLIICCADEPKGEIHKIVAESACNVGAAALFGAVGIKKGVIGPTLINKKSFHSYISWLNEIEMLHKRVIAPPKYPSNGVSNSIIANMIAWEALQFLSGMTHLKTEACVLSFNLNSFSTSMLKGFDK